MRQAVFIVGASGNVGRETVRQICERDLTALGHRNPTEIVGLADRSSLVLSPRGLDPEILLRTDASRDAMKRMLSDDGRKYEEFPDLLDAVTHAGLDGEAIFVDATSAQAEALQFHRLILDASADSIVTANKNPLGLFTMKDFNDLTRFHGRLHYNTTVMAGSGAIDFAIDRMDVRDPILEIEGMFSGTLGFVFSELEQKGTTFSQVVRQALELGYTEPHPYHDLSGIDVARKLIILVRSAGYDVEFDDVEIEPFVDNSLKDLPIDEFFVKLKNHDSEFTDAIRESRRSGATLRYTAKMEIIGGRPHLSIKLRSYSLKSPFYYLTGTQNLVRFRTGLIPEHIIASPGAGLEITAAAIRVGIKKMLPPELQRA